jgi:decaprenylphospho-beta-D-erythro-pentofuranosid-2-ulose 2-reductase
MGGASTTGDADTVSATSSATAETGPLHEGMTPAAAGAGTVGGASVETGPLREHMTPAAAPDPRPDAPARVLVLGGTSEIASAIVREVARRGGAEDVVLVGRDPVWLAAAADTLRSAGCGQVRELTLSDAGPERASDGDAHPGHQTAAQASAGHAATLARATEMLGAIDVAVLAVGALGERGGLPEDVGGAVEVLETNIVCAGSLLLHTAQAIRAQGCGTLVVLSSVAAERPRASNAVYCASKAGIDALARGVDDALQGSGARVMVVRPGFVRTRMTRGLGAPPLACDAQTVARATAEGLRRGAGVVWAPGTLRWVMAALRVLPGPVWRRLAL